MSIGSVVSAWTMLLRVGEIKYSCCEQDVLRLKRGTFTLARKLTHIMPLITQMDARISTWVCATRMTSQHSLADSSTAKRIRKHRVAQRFAKNEGQGICHL